LGAAYKNSLSFLQWQDNGPYLGTRWNPGVFHNKEVCPMCLRIFFKALIMCMVLWGIGGGTSWADTIDAFDSPVGGQSVTILNGIAGSTASSLATGLPTLGGSRKISIEVESILPGGNQTEAAINTFTTPSNYQLTQSTTVNGFGLIIYDANSAGLNADLSGFAGLRLAGVVNDFLTPFSLTLETFGTGSSSTTNSILSGDLDFLFSSLVGTANLTDIDRITIKIDPQMGGDVKIDNITTFVPIPATMLLFGSGLLGLVGWRRFRNS
jgi:hypothetical protein